MTEEKETSDIMEIVTKKEDDQPVWLIENTNVHMILQDEMGNNIEINKPVEWFISLGSEPSFTIIVIVCTMKKVSNYSQTSF